MTPVALRWIVNNLTFLHSVDNDVPSGLYGLQHHRIADSSQAEHGDVVRDADALAGPALTSPSLSVRPAWTIGARTATLANECEQIVAELATGQDVNDEVDGRVEDGHKIADRRVS